MTPYTVIATETVLARELPEESFSPGILGQPSAFLRNPPMLGTPRREREDAHYRFWFAAAISTETSRPLIRMWPSGVTSM
jgi:hypothetical protein